MPEDFFNKPPSGAAEPEEDEPTQPWTPARLQDTLEIPVVQEKKEVRVIEEHSTAGLDGAQESHQEFFVMSEFGVVDARTDRGGPWTKYKTINEDTMFVVSTEETFVVGVIDGAGGSGNGRLASVTATNAALEAAREGRQDMGMLMRTLDEAVKKEAKDPASGKQGYAAGVILQLSTTPDGKRMAEIGYAGDCKAMTIRQGQKLDEGTTKFQNMAQYYVEKGQIPPEGYYTNSRLNVITTSLGGGGNWAPPGVCSFESLPGDMSILASDGFWDVVSEQEILDTWAALQQHGRGSVKDLEDALFRLGMSRNGSDPEKDPQPFAITHAEGVEVEKTLVWGDNFTLAIVGHGRE